MKERPILFSGEMVRAILDGRKTQTRRAIKPQPRPMFLGGCGWYPDGDANKKKHYASVKHFIKGMPIDFCPYGQPGDRLWVREGFRLISQLGPETWDTFLHPQYKSDMKIGHICSIMREFYKPGWKPSIHMPRWASRITLEITDVRVERVQDITDEGIMAEGFGYNQLREDGRMKNGFPIIDGFADLWDSINAKRGYSWDLNPWVWAISFKVKDK